MPHRPHILWLTPFLPAPPLDAGKKRIYSLMIALANRWRLTLLSYVHQPLQAFGAKELESAGIAVRCIPRKPSPVPHGSALPGMIYPFYSEEMNEALQALLAQDPPDAVQIEFFQMAHLALRIPREIPVIYTEHDISHLSRNRSYLPAASGGESPLEIRRRRSLLRRVLGRARTVIALTDWDARRLQKLSPSARIAIIPTGVHLVDYAEAPSERRMPGRILFVGAYPHFPNADAARLLAEMLPAVRSRVPEAHLVLAGSDPTPAVQSLAGPHIRVTGTLQDLKPELLSASVFAAPIRLGFGIKTKLVEAFAAGLPIVTIPQCLRGIPAREGRDVLVARSLADFPRQLSRLLKDAPLRARLSNNGRRLGRRFAWARSLRRQETVYEQIVSLRGEA